MGRLSLLGFYAKSLCNNRQNCRNYRSIGTCFSYSQTGRPCGIPRELSYASTFNDERFDIFRKTVTAPFAAYHLKRSFHATGLCNREKDFYEILGVPKDASHDDIKKAYLALAKKYHPDINKNNPGAKRKFQDIREAYETLTNSRKREQYDREFHGVGREEHVDGDAGSSGTGFYYGYHDHFSNEFRKIFSEIFDEAPEIIATDIQVGLPLSFSEAARGCTKHLRFNARIHCNECKGRGYPIGANPQLCPTCKGIGKVTIPPFTSTCSTCKGFGRIMKVSCAVCKGSGTVEGFKEADITIPAGIDSGDTIRVPKAGHSAGPGVHPGDLVIKVKVGKDPTFARDGADIFVDARINFTQAILGGMVEVPTLSGKIQLRVPNRVQPGQVLILRGKGLPRQVGFMDRGDQHVRFCIQFPAAINERQRTILEEFAREESFHDNDKFLPGSCYLLVELTGGRRSPISYPEWV
ncbi:chaperone protein dnaJ 1, mitochondrial isoform X2 [Amborella trichopoda]|uniref:chaperone protein dnaJ 1, mitochondrial isoform X2 n=1 Tax=Amborella trichopoda TaxID=13333 RepID=UPI0009BF7E55|nr:chaperone protein dnaJ 1, mitochondrial isoform X2 [Amborella trichopoda]|eukprot:XP_020520955.1 chaperone protein dnaJ 1, mitochondrial isoform X2 [Amborella trichopoda]